MANMTWRELGNAIRNMDSTMLDSEAQVFLEDMSHIEYGTSGLWPVAGVVDSKGWNYEKKDYVRWGFITIDISDGDDN